MRFFAASLSRVNSAIVVHKKMDGALLLTTGTIAAIRLRGEPMQSSPNPNATIADCGPDHTGRNSQ
jgi:hypothetical protein